MIPVILSKCRISYPSSQDMADFWPDPSKLPSYVDVDVAQSNEEALANALTSQGIRFGVITHGVDG